MKLIGIFPMILLLCRFRIFIALIALLIGLTGKGFAESAPTPDPYAGFIAVSQIWDPSPIVQIAPNGRFLIVVSPHRIDVVDMESGTILRHLVVTADRSIVAAGISSDSYVIAARLGDGRTPAWDPESGRLLASKPEGVTLTSIAQDTLAKERSRFNVVLSIKPDGSRMTIDIPSGAIHDVVNPPSCVTYAFPLAFDGRFLVYGSHAGGMPFAPATVMELKDGHFHELWHAPCDESGQDGGGQLDEDPTFLVMTRAPVGQVTIWNMKTNRIAASFENADGSIAVAPGGRTFAVAAYSDNDLTTPVFEISQNGRVRTLPRVGRDFDKLFLSPNGRWLAVTKGREVSVLSTNDGRVRQSVEISKMDGLSDDGSPLSDTSDAEIQRVVHGREFDEISDDRHWGVVGQDIFDLTTDRIILHNVGHVDFIDDDLAVLRPEQRLVDLKTGRTLWTLEVTPDVEGYVLTFSDGCVQVAPGSERFVRLVRGFEVRPLDDEATRVFAKPGCKGRPDAMASSEAAFVVDQTILADLARRDEHERIQAQEAAVAEADRQEASRRAAAAYDQRRRNIDNVWEHGEARVAGGPQRAELIVAWPVGLSPGRTSTYRGTITWKPETSMEDGTEAAVAKIDLPDVGGRGTVKLSLSKYATKGDAGTIDVSFEATRPAHGFGVQSITLPVGRDELATSGIMPRGDVSMLSANVFRIDVSSDMERLRSAYWIDFQMLMVDGLRATLTFEKGTTGQQIVDAALKPPRAATLKPAQP